MNRDIIAFTKYKFNVYGNKDIRSGKDSAVVGIVGKSKSLDFPTMLIFWSLVRNSVVLAVYLLFSVACFLTVHEHLSKGYNEVFDSFENLKSISVSKKSKNYYSKSGVLFNKEKDTLLYYPSNKRSKKYTIPNSVKKVAEGSISNIYLQELVISRNVTKIGDENLSEGNLKKVTVLSPNVNYGYMCFDENRGKIKFYGLLNSTTQKFAKNNKFFFKAIKLKYPTVKVKSTKKKTAIISYKKVSGANKYNIYRKTTKGKYKLIKTTNKSSYKDKGLKSKKTYYYKVKAIGSKLKSDTSKAVKVKIK